ncbi:hypothetical protein THAOC_07333 [Thalassiosira oceanica]|uniref:Prokaryotic-type class I peptide chain release factors domain-containing protein n=1 Tax=Thalassiosira oceanica TaxID=159749 RepID=K0TKN9_THAOC|nr:hypothetical protein THAOC_07333 [Thalassiosira oceanica]|eukprot:EJK71247.1 hypothetical protein THAOC_07333 [Thalassiosira oceanica]
MQIAYSRGDKIESTPAVDSPQRSQPADACSSGVLESSGESQGVDPRRYQLTTYLAHGSMRCIIMPMLLFQRHVVHSFRAIYRPTTTALRAADLDNEETRAMDNVYLAWSEEDDKRLTKLTDVDSAAYARLFIKGKDSLRTTDDENKERLTPAQEILRRIKWDPACNSDDFTVLHYDRIDETLHETPFNAENMSIKGKERQFVFALPEHRIEQIKYRERTVWDKQLRLDLVFGSMGGSTIDQVTATYDEWKSAQDEKKVAQMKLQTLVLGKLEAILEESRMDKLKEMSSSLLHDAKRDSSNVRDYVKSAVGLYFDAKKNSAASQEGFHDFLHLLSDLAALLPDESLREGLLKQIEVSILRSSDTSGATSKRSVELPELNEDDIEEKFVKGVLVAKGFACMDAHLPQPSHSFQGAVLGVRKLTRVILLHSPTGVRVECQDTRSLQQNRKLARKRLRSKVDEFVNGNSSRASQAVKKASSKKARNKARAKRRRQKKAEE